MSGRYLLDTNIVIALFADEPIVKSNLQNAKEVFIPYIVIGELCFGAQKSEHTRGNLFKIEEFANNNFT